MAAIFGISAFLLFLLVVALRFVVFLFQLGSYASRKINDERK